MPTRALFGRGIAGQAASHVTALGVRSVLLVTDPGVRAAGLVGPVEALADRQRHRGRDLRPGGAQPERCPLPGRSRVDARGRPAGTGRGRRRLRDRHGQVHRPAAHERRAPARLGGLRRPDGSDPLPVIAIPTTAGTGSEVSPSAVITDTARKKKMNLFDMRNCPRVALVDPDLTLSCPASVTAASGMDALSHAVDSLQCLLATPASDALALEGARLVATYIRRAFSDPSDIEARCGMAQGSLTAGIAVGLTDVSGTHALAEAIGGLYGHPHGYCCAVSMPPIMEYNLPVSTPRSTRASPMRSVPARPGASEAELALAAIEAIRAAEPGPGRAADGSLIRAGRPGPARREGRAEHQHPVQPARRRRRRLPCDVRPRDRTLTAELRVGRGPTAGCAGRPCPVTPDAAPMGHGCGTFGVRLLSQEGFQVPVGGFPHLGELTGLYDDNPPLCDNAPTGNRKPSPARTRTLPDTTRTRQLSSRSTKTLPDTAYW